MDCGKIRRGCRVKPGHGTIRLPAPDDTSAYARDKEEAREKLAKLGTRLAKLQTRLYAEQKRKVLVILQGIDTSGKDGTIRHVFGHVDPLGLSVTGFRKPTDEEAGHDFLWRIHRKVPGRG